MELFRLDFSNLKENRPLARRMAPESLEEFVGQNHLVGRDGPLRKLIYEDRLVSAIFFGPPGSGKTALAQIIAKRTNSPFIAINAQEIRPSDLKRAIREAEDYLKRTGKRAVLFVDEIHRFNRLQQELLLPAIERGTLIFFGSTVQNPFFALSKALLSRTHLFEFKSLSEEDIFILLKRALQDKERGIGSLGLKISEDVLRWIARVSDGDARRAYNMLELIALTLRERKSISIDDVREIFGRRALYFDKSGDEHYDMISAFIKSLRGSDPNASVYWLVRLLESGEDPRFLLRRMLIFASEDIGLADPEALQVASSGLTAFEMVGRPEGDLILTEVALYLATAPKSNTVIRALEKARELVKEERAYEVPKHLKDSHYRGAKILGRGNGYIYPHGKEDVSQDYLPPELSDISIFEPQGIGYEKILMERWSELRERRTSSKSSKGRKEGKRCNG